MSDFQTWWDQFGKELAAKDPEGACKFAWNNSRFDARNFVTNRVEEVKNGIGGVIGYKLNLNMEETERLSRLLDR